MTYPQFTRIIKNEFIPVSKTEPGFCGYLRSDYKANDHPSLSEIIAIGKEYHGNWEGGQVGKIHVRTLKNSEANVLNPARFVNSIMLYETYEARRYLTKPIGLIYEGSAEDFMNGSQGYYLSEFVEGTNLITVIKNMEQPKKKRLFCKIVMVLDLLANKNRYLMDFAPRDIKLDVNSKPIFLDTENVFYDPFVIDAAKFKKMQREQFIEDYTCFLTDEEMVEALGIIFKGVEV